MKNNQKDYSPKGYSPRIIHFQIFHPRNFHPISRYTRIPCREVGVLQTDGLVYAKAFTA